MVLHILTLRTERILGWKTDLSKAYWLTLGLIQEQLQATKLL